MSCGCRSNKYMYGEDSNEPRSIGALSRALVALQESQELFMPGVANEHGHGGRRTADQPVPAKQLVEGGGMVATRGKRTITRTEWAIAADEDGSEEDSGEAGTEDSDIYDTSDDDDSN
ncbi:hypothetical protein B0H13DRAFT_1858872 [Mycena leptocephala]|nr:hypothetical protein B0H13DRAFT_1858872 [Mycena leptocephala]